MELVGRSEIDRKPGKPKAEGESPPLSADPKPQKKRRPKLSNRFAFPNPPKVKGEQSIGYRDGNGRSREIILKDGFVELPKELHNAKDEKTIKKRHALINEWIKCAGLVEVPESGEIPNRPDIIKAELDRQAEGRRVVHILYHPDAVQEEKKINQVYELKIKMPTGEVRTEKIKMIDSVIHTSNKQIRDALMTGYRLQERGLATRYSDPKLWAKFYKQDGTKTEHQYEAHVPAPEKPEGGKPKAEEKPEASNEKPKEKRGLFGRSAKDKKSNKGGE